MNGPAVSVIVGCYNHAEYVTEALDSVASQTCRDFELIVYDDASTDESVARIDAWLARTEFPATFLQNEQNLGVCASRNRALRQAKGQFVAGLAADDAYLPDRIERQLEFFRSLGDEVGFVYSDVECCEPDGTVLDETYLEHKLGPSFDAPEGDIMVDLLRRDFIPAPGVMTRRSHVEAVGGYDESLIAEDLYMWLQLASRYKVRYLPGCVTRYRLLPSSLSRSPTTRPRMLTEILTILEPWSGHCAEWDEAIRRREGLSGPISTAFERKRRSRTMRDPSLSGREVSALLDARNEVVFDRWWWTIARLARIPGFMPVSRRALALRNRARRMRHRPRAGRSGIRQ